MNLRWIQPPVFRVRTTLPRRGAYAIGLFASLMLAGAGISGCIQAWWTQTEYHLTTRDNRPNCVVSLAGHLSNVRHAQPLVGLFVGVSNYSEPSRLWSTPAHTISAALFREPFYLTAGSDAQKADLKLVTELHLIPGSELARSTEHALIKVAGMSDARDLHIDVDEPSMVEPSSRDLENVRLRLLRNAEPTTRKNLLDKLQEALDRAQDIVQEKGSVVFIFYISAHGWVGADGRSYILPSDADFNIPATWIDQQEVLARTGKFLAVSRADGLNRKAILVFDTCRNARGDLPERLAVGAPQALPNAFVVESTSPGSYAWHWTQQSENSGGIKVAHELRWGFPLPPPKAKRGPIEQRLSSNMSVAPIASNCTISEFFRSLSAANGARPSETGDAEPTSAQAGAEATMNASEWLEWTSVMLHWFLLRIPEVRETLESQDMLVSVPSDLEDIPLLEVAPQ